MSAHLYARKLNRFLAIFLICIAAALVLLIMSGIYLGDPSAYPDHRVYWDRIAAFFACYLIPTLAGTAGMLAAIVIALGLLIVLGVRLTRGIPLLWINLLLLLTLFITAQVFSAIAVGKNGLMNGRLPLFPETCSNLK